LVAQGSNQVNITQVSDVQNILNSLQSQTSSQVQNFPSNVQQSVEDILWSLSPIDKSTAQYFYRIAQNISNGGNVSAILSPELEKLTTSSLSPDKVAQLLSNSDLKDFGKFYIQRFESNEELDKYISHPDYGWGGMPGICFGFKVMENSQNDYEVELTFNDLPPSRYDSIPD
jgi:hypothetical protein